MTMMTTIMNLASEQKSKMMKKTNPNPETFKVATRTVECPGCGSINVETKYVGKVKKHVCND